MKWPTTANETHPIPIPISNTARKVTGLYGKYFEPTESIPAKVKSKTRGRPRTKNIERMGVSSELQYVQSLWCSINLAKFVELKP